MYVSEVVSRCRAKVTHVGPLGAEIDAQRGVEEQLRLVLCSLLESLSNKQIGGRLDLTECSVKALQQKLFKKTGVRSRSHLARGAIEPQIAV